MDISIIMWNGGYREKFHCVDTLNNQTFPRERYELFWIEYFDDYNEALDLRNVQIITLDESEPYHLSKCVNEGIRRANGEVIVTLDADVYVPENVLETVWREHQEQQELVLYVHRYDEPEPLPPHNIKRHTANLDRLQDVCELINPQNFGSFMSVRKSWLEKIDGYEEHPIFHDDSAAGKDLNIRFKNFGLRTEWDPDLKVYHPWHPNAFRDWSSQPHVQKQRQLIEWREENNEFLPCIGLTSKNYESPIEL